MNYVIFDVSYIYAVWCWFVRCSVTIVRCDDDDGDVDG